MALKNRKKENPKVLPGRFADPNAATSYASPPFTLKQVRDAIPKHCFEKSVLKSTSYVIIDLFMISLMVFGASKIDLLPEFVQPLAWFAYWVVQPLFGVGIWILAHECGHGAFSNYKWYNNAIGLVLHSIVGIPYFSWKYSHAKHHKSTGHFAKDMVFIPATRSNVVRKYGLDESLDGFSEPLLEHQDSLLEDTPIYQFIFMMSVVIFGFPLYLLYNLGGQEYKKFTSHYLPRSPIFDPNQYWGVVASNLGLLTWTGILTYLGYTLGWMVPVVYFVIPWMQVNAWLVIITYLQHTDGKVPHYNNNEWDFLKGALATVDRDWGFLNVLFHHITDTHVVHHLFSTMPFYNAQEATEHLKNFIGEFYIRDDTFFPVALYQNFKKCRFVEDEGDVLFYKH
jgi:omega-6 fatty acid desaturase (delta-12 desaturase)